MTPTTVRTTHLGTHRELRNGSTKSIFHGTWPLTMPLLHRWDDDGGIIGNSIRNCSQKFAVHQTHNLLLLINRHHHQQQQNHHSHHHNDMT